MTELHIRNIPPMSALEVATLVRVIPIKDAVNLIEQYAACVAAGARCDDALERLSRLEKLS